VLFDELAREGKSCEVTDTFAVTANSGTQTHCPWDDGGRVARVAVNWTNLVSIPLTICLISNRLSRWVDPTGLERIEERMPWFAFGSQIVY